jgi:hypothetical protein
MVKWGNTTIDMGSQKRAIYNKQQADMSFGRFQANNASPKLNQRAKTTQFSTLLSFISYYFSQNRVM